MASKTKIYFWIKLDENFFKNLAIKNLRKTVSGGDTLVIIYQQMLLSSLPNNGVIYYEGTLQDIAQEIVLNLDEKLDDVRLAIDYFQKAGLLQIGDDGSAEMLQVPMLIGQETNWNKYKRDKKLENFQPISNQLLTSSNQAPTEIEKEIELEIELEKEKEKEIERETNIDEKFARYFSIFHQFARKNGNKRAMALQEFMTLPPFQKDEAIIGAENYVKFYVLDNPDDKSHQYSVNAYEFIKNALFGDYQEMPEVKKVAKKKKWI
ncbi:replisome organizer [Lactococcus hircilactis]|uniref:Replisome organizer n=1 Tax=Lactococcus hircilactis TaxID=1494462 RepID=A0A7X2D1N2_9LACT|nr:phage replisome organiser protein [Lactococcus hircilactis]MQW40748.1 replisome organizer [Lactococcus hircilactis]